MFAPLFYRIKAKQEIDNFKQALFLQTGQYAIDFGIYTQTDLDRAVEECHVVFQDGNCIIFE